MKHERDWQPRPAQKPIFQDRRVLFLFVLVTVFDGISSLNNINGPMDRGDFSGVYAFSMAALMAAIIATIWNLRGQSAVRRPAQKPASPDPLLTLRSFACLVVLLGHYFIAVSPAIHFGDMMAAGVAVRLLAAPPYAGVWIFFTLSGYLMGKIFFSGRYATDEAGIRAFYRSRALRIVPVYVTAIVIVSAFQYPEIFRPENLWMLARMAAFEFNDDLPINPIGALWSVSTEVQFYLIAPFVAMAIDRYWLNSWWLLAAVMLAGLAFRLLVFWIWSRFLYTSMAAQLDLFVGGMLLSHILESRSLLQSRRGWQLNAGLCAIAAFYVALTAGMSAVMLGYLSLFLFMAVASSACGVFTLAVIALFETAKIGGPRGLALKIVAATQSIGILTYCIYVVHDPVYLTVRKFLPKDLALSDNIWRFPVIIALVAICSMTLYAFVERPFDRRRA